MPFHTDTVVTQVVMDELEGGVDLLAHIYGGDLRLASAAKPKQVRDECAHTLDLLRDDSQRSALEVFRWHLPEEVLEV